ncbi:amidohydrolase [Niabella yanshanensis]|uniref:Amidohydrolase n=1 Tax=Niabella yanshanensis TaxID=577386 RepID=A0ABZ0W4Z1_9BACT|nr:amidohydrolase [Niabella yanshanensis]WQD37619.1 amidohydrolase [Niabella yanshanensis]
MRKIIFSVALFFCTTVIIGQNYTQSIATKAQAVQPRLVEWRRHIHQNPELSNREFKTQQYVLAHLKKLGIQTDTLAKTGVIGILKGGKPGPVLALRADMDALPVLERNDLSYKSTAKGEYLGKEVAVMHACGHDAHVAILMGTAEVLASMKKDIPGTVKFIFQPAEEGAPPGEEGGAALMVKEGVMDNPRVDAVFGLHIESWIEEGKVFYKPGPFMAASDWFTIKVKGKQSHGAQPWSSVDPIVTGAQIINSLQQIVSRQQDLTKAPVVLTVGKINSGLRNNIIPEELEMAGTIRTFDTAMQEDIHRRLKHIAENVAAANNATVEVSINKNTPVTYNNIDLTRKIVPVLEKAVGKENVQETKWVTGAEDFSYYGAKAPAVFLYYGGLPKGNDPAKAPPHHTPDFIVSDALLQNGVKIFCNIVFEYGKL